jgi:hypothetical protein
MLTGSHWDVINYYTVKHEEAETTGNPFCSALLLALWLQVARLLNLLTGS